MRTSTGFSRVLDIAANQRHMRLAAIDFAGIRDQTEFAEARIDESLAYAVHVALMRHAVADQFRHGEHLHLVLPAKADQVRNAGHAAIILHDLADDSSRNHSCEARQIHGRLGLPGAHQNSAFARPKREDMSGTGEIGRFGRGIDRHLNRSCAVVRGNTGRNTLARINGLAECGSDIARCSRPSWDRCSDAPGVPRSSPGRPVRVHTSP